MTIAGRPLVIRLDDLRACLAGDVIATTYGLLSVSAYQWLNDSVYREYREKLARHFMSTAIPSSDYLKAQLRGAAA
jgi:hypothetical protein